MHPEAHVHLLPAMSQAGTLQILVQLPCCLLQAARALWEVGGACRVPSLVVAGSREVQTAVLRSAETWPNLVVVAGACMPRGEQLGKSC